MVDDSRLERAAAFAQQAIPWTNNQKRNAQLAADALSTHGFYATTQNPSGNRTDKRFAAIGSPTNGILVNPSSPFWKNPVESAKQSYDVGHLSTDDPKGTLLHEIAHTIYDPQGYWSADSQKQTASQVSRYGQTNPKEFVSEVFAGLHTGKTFPEDVMNLYRVMSTRQHNDQGAYQPQTAMAPSLPNALLKSGGIG